MDERLRDLQRRAAHGDLQAEAAVLRRRVAMRELPEKRLRLAALLGHPPAHWIYERTPKVRPGRFDKWVRSLRHFGGEETQRRVELAAARALVPALELSFPDVAGEAREVLDAASSSLEGQAPAAKVRRAANQLRRRVDALAPRRRRADDRAAAQAARSVEAGRAICNACLLAAGTRPWASAVDEAERLLGEAAVREAVRGEVVPWALRVEAESG